MEEGIPLIIPLKAQESYQGHNDELKILLRSVEKNVGRCSCVCIVADRLPEWLNDKADGLRWVRQGDPYTQCKDANLFLKMRVAIQVLGLSGQDRWCFSADDGAFLQPCDLPTLPLIYNGTPVQHYMRQMDRKWYRRMVNTFAYLKWRGVNMAYSYDCHVPQVFEAADLLERLDGVPYDQGAGFCIYTLWRGLEGITSGGILQPAVVSRYGSVEDVEKVPLDKLLCTYDNTPFGAGLKEKLFEMFPDKSRFEK